MPPVSKAQSKFLRGVQSGSIKAPGLSRDKAAESVDDYPTKGLPERVKAKDGEEKAEKKPFDKDKKPKGKKSARTMQRRRQMKRPIADSGDDYMEY